MKKQSKLLEDLSSQWVLLKKWLRSFPLPPKRVVLILILVPLPLLVVHAVLKKYFQARRKKNRRARRKRRLTPLQRARLLKALRAHKRKEVPEREILEDLTSEPFEESFLQVVPDNGFDEEITQGSLWDDIEESAQLPPGEEAPLLQRAFRLVSDE